MLTVDLSNPVDSNALRRTSAFPWTHRLPRRLTLPTITAGPTRWKTAYFLTTGTITNEIGYTITGLPANTARLPLSVAFLNFSHSDSGDPTGQPSRGYTITATGQNDSCPAGPVPAMTY